MFQRNLPEGGFLFQLFQAIRIVDGIGLSQIADPSRQGPAAWGETLIDCGSRCRAKTARAAGLPLLSIDTISETHLPH
jgi:hypothetical protein